MFLLPASITSIIVIFENQRHFSLPVEVIFAYFLDFYVDVCSMLLNSHASPAYLGPEIQVNIARPPLPLE